MSLRFVAAAALVASGAAYAQNPETMTWLRKISQANQKTSYSGIFVYQSGPRTEASRIARDAPNDVEKLVVLDGMPREIVRTRDTVSCYLPGIQVVKVDRRIERDFPALLPERVSALVKHYDISLGDKSRIAGSDCQGIVLKPRDKLRYGYHFCADVNNGVLLRVVTVDVSGEQVEQFSFTELRIGGVTPAMLKPPRGYRVEDSGAERTKLAEWGLSSELPGFHKVIELKLRLGATRPANQMVFSDGLAGVSVFIEALGGRADPVRAGLSNVGALHMYTREVANHVVTVVGDAPAASVQRIANAVEYRPAR